MTRREDASTPERERLRATFDEDAERYDRARPSYPAELIDELIALAGIGPGSRVLEIGCGTGQATLPLARTGCRLVAVELGPHMAAVARRNLAAFPGVNVVTSSFEDWPLPPELFDAVISATAFYWIDPAVRVAKAAAALRPGGALVTVNTHHVAGGTQPFFDQVQACYERWDPATPPGLRLPRAADVPQDDEEFTRSGLFDPAIFRRHEREHTYSTAAYLDLLATYSGHRALDATARASLLDCIAHLIDTSFNGVITKRYLFELRLAHRAEAAAG